MMMLSGIVMAIASAVLGVIWALFNIKLEAKEEAADIVISIDCDGQDDITAMAII